MDEMKLNLSTSFMKKMIAKIITRGIRKKLGVNVDLNLNEISIEMIDGEVSIHANVDGKLDKEEFKKIIKTIAKEES